ncbi:uncharacterized protein TNCT_614481 [Trichonephila clavata]|uniref:Mutator-like transposase domain-containing protein n=1 Tax=Trichonephila clavata TaxID=2740835 RepID=A0A8X6JXV0_TRICU|nr:uncharacterized protein TNCT_614481 [Trichonephila clavata]
MPRTKRKNKSSKLSIQKRWCTETKTESNMDISEHNSNVAQRSSGDRILKNERISMQEKSVLEQENIADTYDGPSYIIVDKNALCDIFKYTLCGICNQSTLKLEFGHKYGFSHQLKLVCKTCSEQKMECFTSPRLEKKSNTSTPFDVNVRAVQAFLAISGGHASVEKFCMFLNMPLMSTTDPVKSWVWKTWRHSVDCNYDAENLLVSLTGAFWLVNFNVREMLQPVAILLLNALFQLLSNKAIPIHAAVVSIDML